MAVLGDNRRRPSHICYDVMRWSAATWALDTKVFTGSGIFMWQATWPLLVGKRALEGHLFVPPEYRDELSNIVPFDGDEEALWALRIEKGTTVLDLFGLAAYEMKAEVWKGQIAS